MDAAGKDSSIKHVMSGINPQGCQVHSFKAPPTEELDHGYLWRWFRALPERGKIGIFNRSYYEKILVARAGQPQESIRITSLRKTITEKSGFQPCSHHLKVNTHFGRNFLALTLPKRCLQSINRALSSYELRALLLRKLVSNNNYFAKDIAKRCCCMNRGYGVVWS
jgi:hypothetical protein